MNAIEEEMYTEKQLIKNVNTVTKLLALSQDHGLAKESNLDLRYQIRSKHLVCSMDFPKPFLSISLSGSSKPHPLA